MPRLHKFGDPLELLGIHLIYRDFHDDGNSLQSRAHHRETQRGNNDHLHRKQGKGEGHSGRCQIFEVLQQTTPFGTGETFHGRVKENTPRLFGTTNEREELDLREVSWDTTSNVLIKREEYRCGITSSSSYAPVGISSTSTAIGSLGGHQGSRG